MSVGMRLQRRRHQIRKMPAWPQFALEGGSRLKSRPIFPQSCLKQMDESAGHHSSPVKKIIIQLSFYTHTPKSPTCPTLNADLASVPTPRTPPPLPPAVLTAVSCIPAAEHLKNDRNGLLGQLKESWSWFSLGTINKRTAWNKQSG